MWSSRTNLFLGQPSAPVRPIKRTMGELRKRSSVTLGHDDGAFKKPWLSIRELTLYIDCPNERATHKWLATPRVEAAVPKYYRGRKVMIRRVDVDAYLLQSRLQGDVRSGR